MLSSITDIAKESWETVKDARLRIKDKIHFPGPPYKSRKLADDGRSDYCFKKDTNSVWIKIKDYHVYLRKLDNGVSAEIIVINNDGEFKTISHAEAFDNQPFKGNM